MIIAIDGPAASGKSSTAKAVAKRLGFRHLESGAFYRAVTYAVLQKQIDPMKWPRLHQRDLDEFNLKAQPTASGFTLMLNGEDVSEAIRSPKVTAHVSQIAALPQVRSWLREPLRSAGHAGNLVADGRDMATVIFPDADLKVFLTAEAETRARRRLAQIGVKHPSDTEIQNEAKALLERDRVDSERATAPLMQAPDAVVIDTTRLDFEEQVETIVRLARAKPATR